VLAVSCYNLSSIEEKEISLVLRTGEIIYKILTILTALEKTADRSSLKYYVFVMTKFQRMSVVTAFLARTSLYERAPHCRTIGRSRRSGSDSMGYHTAQC
jgi:hypothetical protein